MQLKMGQREEREKREEAVEYRNRMLGSDRINRMTLLGQYREIGLTVDQVGIYS